MLCYRPPPSEVDPYSMGKILSYGYAKDWEQDRDVWEAKQEKMREVFDNSPHPRERMQTEYQAQIENNGSKRNSGKGG